MPPAAALKSPKNALRSPTGNRLKTVRFSATTVVCLLAAIGLYRNIQSLPPVCPAPGEQPRRIVSLSLGTDEILVDLVPPGRVAGLTYLSDDPAYSNVADKALRYPRHTARSVEEVAALRPDLIVGGTFNNPEKLEALRALGCRVVAISGFDSMDGVQRSVRQVAAAVAEPLKGETIIRNMNRVLRESARYGHINRKKFRVLFAGPSGYSQGTGTIINDLIVRAGGINAASERIKGIGRLSPEEWLAARPDVLLRTSYSPVDPHILRLYQVLSGRPPPKEIVMPFRLLTSVSPSSAGAIHMLAEKLRAVQP